MPDIDDILNKQLPQSLEAEQAVLGSMLIDSRCVGEVVGILKPEDFHLRQNQEIYETIYRMFSYSMAIDVVTVLGNLATLTFEKDELVFATMRFQTREYNGQLYMDIVATEIIKR